MAGGSSGRGVGRGGRSLGSGSEDRHRGAGFGGHSLGSGSEDGRGGRSLGCGSEDGCGGRPLGLGPRNGCGRGDGRGGRPLGLRPGDGCGREYGQRGRPAGCSSGEGHGGENGYGGRTSSSSAPPPALSRQPTPHTSSPTALVGDESPGSPTTPTIGSGLGDQVAASSENAASSNSKPLLKIAYKVFTPSHVASGQITKCIKQRFDKGGYTWSAVSEQTKDYYWNEFQKHFSFDRDLSVVRSIWECQAGKRYSGTLCEWRKSGKRPVNVPQETWDSWQQEWNTPEFKNKCLKASQNRLSEVAGPGNGPSKHSGDSRSAIDHSIQLAKELGRPVTDYDVFERIHKKSNGEFVDKRLKNVAEEVMARYNAATENQIDDGENSSIPVDLSTIYYEVVGPLKKQRVYGLGCKPSAAIPGCSSSKSAQSDRDQLRAELYEEVREEMRQRQEEMEQQMRQRQEQMELEWRQKQQEMEDLIQRVLRGGGPSVPPTDPLPADDDYAEDLDLHEG